MAKEAAAGKGKPVVEAKKPAEKKPKAEKGKRKAAPTLGKMKARSRRPLPKMIAPGIPMDGRSTRFHRSGDWSKAKQKTLTKEQVRAIKKATKERKIAKLAKQDKKTIKTFQGRKVIISPKVRRIFERVAPRAARKKGASYPAKLRKSIKPGQVLILLAGPHRGKRVVFLRQLPSGLLTVTGPYRVNGVPLRRVDQRYVIATKTRVPLKGLKLETSKLSDEFFNKRKEASANRNSKEKKQFFFARKAKRICTVSKADKEMQQTIDTKLIPAIAKVPALIPYLKATFGLSKGDKPHRMVF